MVCLWQLLPRTNATARPHWRKQTPHSRRIRWSDRAFANRISRCFDSLCDNFEDEQAVRLFVDRFKRATDAWNAASNAVAQEYPKGLVATPVED
jgi:hypothetical protein